MKNANIISTCTHTANNHNISENNMWFSFKTTLRLHSDIGNNIQSCLLVSFQVDANAIFVDYSNITIDLNYFQSVSDLRVAARYVTK